MATPIYNQFITDLNYIMKKLKPEKEIDTILNHGSSKLIQIFQQRWSKLNIWIAIKELKLNPEKPYASVVTKGFWNPRTTLWLPNKKSRKF